MPYCKRCGHHSNSYYIVDDEKKIISCENKLCGFLDSFCDSSNKNYCSFKIYFSENSLLKGIYINDSFSFENENLKNKIFIPIGCTTYEDNLFYMQKADGIIGLSNSGNNLVNILYDLKVLKNNLFSICLSQNGGYFSFSEIYNKYHKENISYININKNTYFYEVNISEIFINNNEIINKTKLFPATIDSGTTLTQVPIIFSNKIIDYIQEKCEKLENDQILCGEYYFHKELNYCLKFDSNLYLLNAIENIWPNITFLLNNKYYYIWQPKNYFFNISNNEEIVGCLGFIPSYANKFILGANWMISHDIIFDNGNNLIGFVESDCSMNNTVDNDIDDTVQPFNENVFDFGGNDKFKFIFYVCIIFILIVIIIFLVISILYLRKGKNLLCFRVSNRLIEEEFLENEREKKSIKDKKNINDKSNSVNYTIEMNMKLAEH